MRKPRSKRGTPSQTRSRIEAVRVSNEKFATQRGSCRFQWVNRQNAKTAKEPRTHVDHLAHRVIGAALEVHRVLGPGFLESVYEEALCIELTPVDVRFARQVPISIRYKNQAVGEARLDLLVDGLLVVELKAVECLVWAS